MKTEELNLLIFEDDGTPKDLEHSLKNKFGNTLDVLTFSDAKSCLEEVDRDTHIVILNNKTNSSGNLELIKSIKEVNPNTEVIVLSDYNDIAAAIEAYETSVKNIILKGPNSGEKIARIVKNFFTAPIRFIVKELGLSERLAIFLMSFLTIGFIVLVWAIIRH